MNRYIQMSKLKSCDMQNSGAVNEKNNVNF